jgi:GNAT superfamily N-acetyltransferase
MGKAPKIIKPLPTPFHDMMLIQLQREHLDTLIAWALKEGWDPGRSDANAFWDTDPEGYVGVLHQEELIAGGSIVSYNGNFGFMGFFIVLPEYRGKGLGRLLWYERKNLLLHRLKPHAPIGMDGVVAMQSFYRKGGFELSHRDVRFKTIGRPFNLNPAVRKILPDQYNEIQAIDSRCFGYVRTHFLRSWLSQPGHIALKYYDGHKICGYAVLRPTSKGFKIGPLFADHKNTAQGLLEACLNQAQGKPVYLDVPEINAEGIELIQAHAFEPVFECGRMYHGVPPKLPYHNIYGVTTFELG